MKATSLQQLKRKRKRILAIAQKHGASQIRVFGSVARGEDKPTSDIDLLVKLSAKPSPWFPAGMTNDLEKLLGRRVEIVTERGLNPHLRKYILKEAVPL
ncbi:MAG: DNA polymerase subunit beta [Chloroflexi bacterium UTCFX4]|jgi:predicted nucleotidyltransferase|nr:MAG: DNA polymerase subunit beta [Chloroflexi bacterium UTCFX4]